MKQAERSTAPRSKGESVERVSPRPLASIAQRAQEASLESKIAELHQALCSLHLFLRSERLYDKHHPRRLESLDSAYDAIHNVSRNLNGLELYIERGGLLAPKLSETHLPDTRGEMQALAADLQRAGVQTLVFGKNFHVGELDTFAQ